LKKKSDAGALIEALNFTTGRRYFIQVFFDFAAVLITRINLPKLSRRFATGVLLYLNVFSWITQNHC
jgi:hypothetical protein